MVKHFLKRGGGGGGGVAFCTPTLYYIYIDRASFPNSYDDLGMGDPCLIFALCWATKIHHRGWVKRVLLVENALLPEAENSLFDFLWP